MRPSSVKIIYLINGTKFDILHKVIRNSDDRILSVTFELSKFQNLIVFKVSFINWLRWLSCWFVYTCQARSHGFGPGVSHIFSVVWIITHVCLI